jgi:glycosyltransferase involved in cell wall biosynthesis
MSTLLAINNYYYPRGGSEAVFFEHNRLLEALGWQVVPFSMKHVENLATPWSEHFVDELELSGDYSLAEKLVRLPKVIYSIEARRRLERLLDSVRPDIAHAHNIYHHLSPSILGVLRSRSIPTVLTLHDLKIACPAYTMLTHDGICERCRGGRLHNVVLNRCIGGSRAMSLVVMLEAMLHQVLGSYRRCVDCFIVPSRFYLDKLCDWGWEASRFAHVPNFIDASRYEPDYSPGSAFIYFGRLTRQKGTATLIRAVAATRRTLLVAGQGPDLAELRRLADELKADVRFLGQLSGDALHAAVRASRAVVLPSEWYENAPISVLEAYALGKPVIGARIGGIPELVRDDETGLGFESGDVNSLAAALERMASSADTHIEELGRRGRKWVEQEFTPAMYRRRILAVYHDLGVRSSAREPAVERSAG